MHKATLACRQGRSKTAKYLRCHPLPEKLLALSLEDENLPKHIRRTRKNLGLSQKQLGEKTAMRQPMISLLETGYAAARLESLLTVLAALGLELQIAPCSKDWDKEMENYL